MPKNDESTDIYSELDILRNNRYRSFISELENKTSIPLLIDMFLKTPQSKRRSLVWKKLVRKTKQKVKLCATTKELSNLASLFSEPVGKLIIDNAHEKMLVLIDTESEGKTVDELIIFLEDIHFYWEYEVTKILIKKAITSDDYKKIYEKISYNNVLRSQIQKKIIEKTSNFKELFKFITETKCRSRERYIVLRKCILLANTIPEIKSVEKFAEVISLESKFAENKIERIEKQEIDKATTIKEVVEYLDKIPYPHIHSKSTIIYAMEIIIYILEKNKNNQKIVEDLRNISKKEFSYSSYEEGDHIFFNLLKKLNLI